MIYPKIKIKDFAKIKGGKRLPKGEELVSIETNHPYIRAQDIGNGKIAFNDPVFLADSTFNKIKKYIVKTNDVCITIVGAYVGDVGIVPSFLNGANLTENAVKLTDLRDYDARFLNYALLNEDSQSQMKLFAAGAAQPKLGLYKIEEIKVPNPPLQIQRKIASILSAYDDLIENNTRRIKILEELAQALYREWFVHFRFPGHEKVSMVESPLGRIPEGWETKTLASFGKVVTGKTPSKKVPEYFGDYMPFIKTPDIHGNIFCVESGEKLSELGVNTQNNKTLPPNSLCVSCIGTAGIVSITGKYSQTNQQINSIVLNDMAYREFLYLALLDLRETIHQYGANGATMVNLNKGKFEALTVVFPGKKLLIRFHEATFSIFEQIKILQLKNANLRRTRGLLLPKLISEDLDISKLEIAERRSET